MLKKYLSGKRDSNSRPRPWQGCALPAELFPHIISLSLCKKKVRYLNLLFKININEFVFMEDISRKVKVLIDFFKTKQLVPTELDYKNEYQLLTAVVLSAQCLDKRVNKITPKLFEKYKSFEELSNARKEDVYEIIKSISYPEVKTERIINISKIIVEKYQGKMPQKINDLTSIGGIGRKTANLVLAVLYDYPGIAVDTHVARVSYRFGLTESKNADKIEKDLSQIFPQEYWNKINPWFVIFGRYTCKAIKPICNECKLKDLCIINKTS